MVDLPADGEGLSWIVSHDPTQLLLIPGLQPAAIVAAAEGDQQALNYLRFTAQHHAAYPGVCVLNALDSACLEAAESDRYDDHATFLAALQEADSCIATVLKTHQDFTVDQLYKAAQVGELAALMWMRAICWHTWPIREANISAEAAGAGQLHILKYMQRGPDPHLMWDDDVQTEALPHLDCLKWLLSAEAPGGPEVCDDAILSYIAEHHGLPALQWFRADGKLPAAVWNEHLFAKAAEMGDQAMLQWLRAQDPPIPEPETTAVCQAAARRGNISMLGWLRAQDPPYPWDGGVTAAAATSTDVATLQWLRAQDPPCPWGPYTCAAAARSGRIDTLMWLRAQDPPCPWDKTCFSAATTQPNAEVLQWLHDNGCPARFDSCNLSDAAYCGHLAVLEWLCDHGAKLTGRLYILAARCNHCHVLKFLHKMKTPWPATMTEVESSTSMTLRTLMSLADIGVPLADRQMRQVRAARRAGCTLHGLVRWYRRKIFNPSRGAHQAFDSLAEDRSGQMLLYRLTRLPPELINKIATAADLQHDLELSS